MQETPKWTSLFKELSKKLVDYREKANDLKKNLPDSFSEKDIANPFNILCKCTQKENFSQLKNIASEFGLDKILPNGESYENYFKGLATQPYFYSGDDPKININLWELFESAVNYSENPSPDHKDLFINSFNTCNILKIPNVATNRLTIGLYWINPKFFLNLGYKNELPNELNNSIKQLNLNKVTDGNSYLEYIEKIRKFLAERNMTFCDYNNYLNELTKNNPSINKENNMSTEKNNDLGKAQEKIQSYCDMLKSSKNLILTGAPGTGKTHLAWEIALKLTEDTNENHPHIEFCQFHPSYDYTDFVEGLRPVKSEDTNGNIRFERKDGVFKSFCKTAIQDYYKKPSDDELEKLFDSTWDKFLKELGENYNEENPLELETVKQHVKFKVYKNSKSNLTVKTNGPKKDDFTLTKDGIKKDWGEDWNNKTWRKSHSEGVFNYWVKKYSFFKTKEDARNSFRLPSSQKYVFIIDEINRGDLAKIFGELFFAIDPGYRVKLDDKQKFTVTTQYSNLIDDNDDIFKNGFYVPDNVYIIGTMNDIDRNVESIDFAIRRRFTWREILPISKGENYPAMWLDPKTSIPIINDIDKALNCMKAINQKIRETEGLGTAYQLGAAYFLKLRELQEENSKKKFDKLWEYHIEPLIKEYLRGMPDSKGKMVELKTAWDTWNNEGNNATPDIQKENNISLTQGEIDEQ